MEDIVSVVSQFLTEKECWRLSRVSKTWQEGSKWERLKRIKQIISDVKTTHYLDNFCPCLAYQLMGLKGVQWYYGENALLQYYACLSLKDKGPFRNI